MALTHEFGIIDDIADNSYESYTPEKYQCIYVDDEVVSTLMEPLAIMKTYFHTLDRPEYGLAYHGITLIPPTSLATFLEVVLRAKPHDDLNALGDKIMQAKREQKYMIHYGI